MAGSNSRSSASNSTSQPSVQAQLKSLTSVAKTLNDLSDRLNDYVSDIDKSLGNLNLGVRGSVEVEKRLEDVQYNAYAITSLEYMKVSGKWCVAITRYVDADPEDTWESWAFKDAPRDLRISAVEKVPSLVDELIKKSAVLAEELNNTVLRVSELATSLSQVSASDFKEKRGK